MNDKCGELLERQMALYNSDAHELIKERCRKNAKMYESIAGFINECEMRRM